MVVTRIEALGFRSLRYVSQRLGPFHVLVGPNASGKSAFLDVLAFLGDLQRVGVAQAITGNASQDVPLRAVDPQHLTWMRRGSTFELAVEATIPDDLRERPLRDRRCRQSAVTKLRSTCRSRSGSPTETLWLKPVGGAAARTRAEQTSRTRRSRRPGSSPIRRSVLPTGWKKDRLPRGGEPERVTFRAETSARPITLHLRGRPGRPRQPDPVARRSSRLRTVSGGCSSPAWGASRPWGDAMRRPSPSQQLRTTIAPTPRICRTSSTPMAASRPPIATRTGSATSARRLPDVENITTIKRPEDGHRYLVVHYRNGLEAPSWLVSDGTLRFLALTLPAYLPYPERPLSHRGAGERNPPPQRRDADGLTVLHLRRPDSRGHPLAGRRTRQVRTDQLLCFARDDKNGTDVVVGSAHPRLRDWPGAVDLGLLLGSGVLG